MNQLSSTTSSPAPRTRLLRSLQSAILLDERGDVELQRETRGANVEWGGVYGQLARLTGRWRVSLDSNDGMSELPPTRTASRVTGDRYESWHRIDRLVAHQDVVPLLDAPGAVRELRLSLTGGEPVRVEVTSSFEPFLLPVLVEGLRPLTFHVETRPDEIRVRQRAFALSCRFSVAPSHLLLNRASWLGGRSRGPVEEVASVHDVTVSAGAETRLLFSIVGGLERDLDRLDDPAGRTLRDPASEATESERREAAWLTATPVMRFPAAPRLERAYALARASVRRLYSSPGEGLTGLVAGYPWYSALWCRDIAWMIPAVLWLGDTAWAAQSIASVLRFQARAELGLLGGEAGELPMQLSPGPIFLYGTSDTTLYYPELALRFVRHSGDASVIGAWLPAIERAIAWGRHRTDDATGLIRNGGEAQAMETATGSIARVRCGIDAPDTTIWDSADRRDHAIDVQVLWYQALRSAVELAGNGSEAPAEGSDLALAARTATSVRTRYAWADQTYLYDSLREGQPVARVRPNALRAVSAGLIDPANGRSIVRRAAQDDLATPWGMRTLSSADPEYSPVAYHDGQVWTIATAWAADAALAVGERSLGVDFLDRIAARYIAEDGDANECYRGDRPEPFNSCFLLGFSVAPFLTVLFERLWGLSVDARRRWLGVSPRFPDGWPSASIAGVRVGQGRVAIDWTPESIDVAWSGPADLTVSGPSGSRRVEPGGRGTLATT
jgi:glycogen debranching enzyme